LVKQYQISSNLYRARAEEGSPILGQTLAQLGITARYNVSIVEIRRRSSAKNPFFKSVSQELAGPSSAIHEGDILYVFGSFDQVDQFAQECGLMLLDKQDTEKLGEGSLRSMLFQEIGIAEVLLTPDSKLI